MWLQLEARKSRRHCREEQRDLWYESRTNKRAQSFVKKECLNAAKGSIRDSSFQAEKPSPVGAAIQRRGAALQGQEDTEQASARACTHCGGRGTWKHEVYRQWTLRCREGRKKITWILKTGQTNHKKALVGKVEGVLIWTVSISKRR